MLMLRAVRTPVTAAEQARYGGSGRGDYPTMLRIWATRILVTIATG